MEEQLLKVVRDFLLLHLPPHASLLLGLSGGADSLALLHLLIKCRSYIPFDLQVAHLDHGWRVEGEVEAQKVGNHLEGLQIPFHLHRLKNGIAKENEGRKARLLFFRSLYRSIGSHALVLAHHADDQAETVLKRILEGAFLFSLGSIRPLSSVEGMQIWRPLLSIKKKLLEDWLLEKGLSWSVDATNGDLRYLRGRMRKLMLPSLEEQFGKNVSNNLVRFASFAQEIGDYLGRRTAQFESLVETDKEEIRVDFSSHRPLEKIELIAFLKKFIVRNRLHISHSALERLARLIIEGKLSKKVDVKGGFIYVRGSCMILRKEGAFLDQGSGTDPLTDCC